MSTAAAANEAQVVISADPAAFAKFMVEAARSFRDLEKEGKGSVKAIDNQITRLRDSVQQLSKAALSSVMATATDPLRQALSGALVAAKEYRQESTRIMGSTGEDWRKIGAQVDDLSRRTARMPQDVTHYADAVRELTGNWKTARAGAADYSELSRYLGRATLAEMAPLAGVMDTMFGVRGQGRAKEFFDATIRGAELLGQSGRVAVQGFERLAPMIGMQTSAGPAGEKFARSAAAMLPALQKMGLSPQQAEAAVGQASSYFSGDLQGLQRQLRSAGLLGKKERLQDEYGRLNRGLPELIDMVSQLSAKHAKGLGGGDELHRKLLQQNLPGLLGGVAYHSKDLKANVDLALGAGQEKGPSPLTQNEQALRATPQLKRQLAEIDMAAAARRTKGEWELGLEDQGAQAGSKAMSAGQQLWLRSTISQNENTLALRRRGGWREKLARVTDWSSDDELREQTERARKELGSAGVAAYERNRDLVKNGTWLEQLRGKRAGAAPPAAATPLLDEWRSQRGAAAPALFSPAAGPESSRPQLSSQDRREQAEQTANAMASKVLTVRFAVSAPTLSGGGNQDD